MKQTKQLISSIFLIAIFMGLSYGQEGVFTYATDPVYPTMDAPVTIYVNVLSEEVLTAGHVIDTDSIVTAYTGLITTASLDNTSNWQHVANSDWNDISLEMTKENDSIYSYTIDDPAAFYDVVPSTEPVFRMTFIARGTSNDAVNGQTLDLFIEVFDSEPTEVLTSQPQVPFATESLVLTFNSVACDSIQEYADTLYAHTGLVTTSSTSDEDLKFVLNDWGENTVKSCFLQVNDSIYRFYIFPNMHSFYNTENAENIEKMSLVIRTKEETFQQTTVFLLDITDTLVIEDPDKTETLFDITQSVVIYPNPAKEFLNIQLNESITGELTIKIYNLLGENVLEQHYLVSGGETLQIRLDEIDAIQGGLLFYSIEAERLSEHGKVLLID